MTTVYAILYPENLTAEEFNVTYVPQLEEWMDNHAAFFIFSDAQTLVTRFFHKRRFRNCRIYHTGVKPVWNPGNYDAKRFQTLHECHAAMLVDCDHVFGWEKMHRRSNEVKETAGDTPERR